MPFLLIAIIALAGVQGTLGSRLAANSGKRQSSYYCCCCKVPGPKWACATVGSSTRQDATLAAHQCKFEKIKPDCIGDEHQFVNSQQDLCQNQVDAYVESIGRMSQLAREEDAAKARSETTFSSVLKQVQASGQAYLVSGPDQHQVLAVWSEDGESIMVGMVESHRSKYDSMKAEKLTAPRGAGLNAMTYLKHYRASKGKAFPPERDAGKSDEELMMDQPRMGVMQDNEPLRQGFTSRESFAIDTSTVNEFTADAVEYTPSGWILKDIKIGRDTLTIQNDNGFDWNLRVTSASLSAHRDVLYSNYRNM